MSEYNGNFPIPVHPGEMLQDLLNESGVSQHQLARHMKIDTSKINEICRGRRGISADMAVALSKVFGTSATMWLNAQKDWELSKVDRAKYRALKRIKLQGHNAA